MVVPHSTDKMEIEGRNVFSKVGFMTEEATEYKNKYRNRFKVAKL